jgi:hypothetical protein
VDSLKNPWLDFQVSESMIHELDRNSVQDHNSKVEAKYRFLTHLAPEPWIGNPNADILVLLANPGATTGDLSGKTQKGADLINKLSISNLKGELIEYPHFFFDPQLIGTDGYVWYAKRFKHLIDATSQGNVAKKVLSCELVPYHSFSWKKPKIMPVTQKYTFNLVKQAMERDAVILIGRGKKDWFENVPGLEKYSKYFQPASVQCAYISPNNYGNNFNKIVEAIS